MNKSTAFCVGNLVNRKGWPVVPITEAQLPRCTATDSLLIFILYSYIIFIQTYIIIRCFIHLPFLPLSHRV